MNATSSAALTESPAATLIAMDFDGTLAAIVDDPAEAVPVPGVLPVLSDLVSGFGRVAVVSGRPVEFLATRLPVPGVELVGQYGLERLVDGVVIADPAAVPYVPAVAEVARRAETELDGVLVERKGDLAVTLHWRRTPAAGGRAEGWAEAIAAELGLRRLPTRMAVELRPPVTIDKGTAVDTLLAGMRRACFAGDDHGDLAAFRALGEARDAGHLDAIVRVAVRSPEEPAELVAAADEAVDGPTGFLTWLRALGPRRSDAQQA